MILINKNPNTGIASAAAKTLYSGSRHK